DIKTSLRIAVHRLAGLTLHGSDIISVDTTSRIDIPDEHTHLWTDNIADGARVVFRVEQVDRDILLVGHAGEIHGVLIRVRPDRAASYAAHTGSDAGTDNADEVTLKREHH